MSLEREVIDGWTKFKKVKGHKDSYRKAYEELNLQTINLTNQIESL